MFKCIAAWVQDVLPAIAATGGASVSLAFYLLHTAGAFCNGMLRARGWGGCLPGSWQTDTCCMDACYPKGLDPITWPALLSYALPTPGV